LSDIATRFWVDKSDFVRHIYKLVVILANKNRIEMKLIEKEIDDWIKSYVTINGDIKVDENLRKSDLINYYLKITIPNIFESYAIIFHSFWINNKIKKEKLNIDIDDEDDEKDFERINWTDFFKSYNHQFKIENCLEIKEKISSENGQFNNELYPGEGLCDKEHLISLKSQILEIYGVENIYVYYTFLSTENWKSDKLYFGKITEIEELLNDNELRLTPSLIYSENKNWVLNSDYDLPFSLIGGEKKLIEKLVKENHNEIFEIQYK